MYYRNQPNGVGQNATLNGPQVRRTEDYHHLTCLRMHHTLHTYLVPAPKDLGFLSPRLITHLVRQETQDEKSFRLKHAQYEEAALHRVHNVV